MRKIILFILIALYVYVLGLSVLCILDWVKDMGNYFIVPEEVF